MNTSELAKTSKSKGGQPENTNAVFHGIYSRSQDALRLRARRVRRRVANCYQNYPWLTPYDKPAVQSWAELDVITSIMFTLLEQGGVVSSVTKDGDYTIRRLLSEYRNFMNLKSKYEHELGMSPAGRLSLGSKAILNDSNSSTLNQWAQGGGAE